MNGNNERKNVDKICPLFGSHMIPLISKVPGVFGQQILGGEFKLINCQKERCQLWIKLQELCSIERIATGITYTYLELEGIKLCLRDIFDNLHRVGDR